MALVIEDGSIVAGANSLVTRADYIAYALDFGIVIDDDEAADVELIKAIDYMASKEGRMKGTRVERDQPLFYPRSGVTIDGWDWSETEIPRQAITCQMQLALDIHAGIDLYNPAPVSVAALKRVKVDVIEQEFAVDNVKPSKLSRESSSQALLNSLLKFSGLSLTRR